MPDPKNYFSFLDLADGSRWYVKDEEARADIARILEIIQNGSRYIGKFVSAVVGGETVDDLHEGDVPTSITTSTGTYVTDTPSGSQKQLMAGDYTQIVRSGKSAIELMWNGETIDEFGSTSVLKALAFKDSASGSYTPAGTNAASQVTFASNAGSDFVTGYNNDAVAPSFTEGAFNAGSLPSKEADSFSAGTLPTKAADSFSAGSLPTLTPVSGEEGLAFNAGALPSYTEGAFNAGSLPSFTEGAFDAGSLPSKAADTFSAGSAATLAKAKALTHADTGEAAAQTFTGTAATITVS